MDSGNDSKHSPNGELRAFREAVECAGHSIYWTDTTGTIEYVNDEFEAQTGFSAEEAVGSNASILQSGVHDERFYERLWDTILAGDVWEGEIVNERKNNDRYVAKQTISPITDESGDIVRFVAVNEDITEMREYQNRLKAKRDRFADLLDAVPVPLVLTNFEGGEPVVEQLNEAFEEKFCSGEQELIGSSLDRLIVDDAESEQANDINEQIRRGEKVQKEVTRRTARGDERTFLLYATPIRSDDSTEALGTYIDITDRKRAEEKLTRKKEELEDFASVVSHDLRNPLNVAMGHLELVANDMDAAELDTVATAHSRMESLIEDILILAKQGKTVDELEALDMETCVSRTWKTTVTNDAELNVERSITIRADETRVRQLCSNLIRNAIEHGGRDVTVTIGALPDGFYFEDTGPGIPAADRTTVFESGYTSSVDGTGFGLAIVQAIADAHGWDVRVTDGDDGGARFEFTGVSLVDGSADEAA